MGRRLPNRRASRQSRLHPFESLVRLHRKLDTDRVTRAHDATLQHDAHDPGLAPDLALVITIEHRMQQSGPEVVDLLTRVTQPGHLDNSSSTKGQPRAPGKGEEVDAPRGDVLPQLPGIDVESLRSKLVVQFGMDQVDLTKVGLGGVSSYARAVLDCHPRVSVTLNAEAGDQGDLLGDQLGEAVAAVEGHGNDLLCSAHPTILSVTPGLRR